MRLQSSDKQKQAIDKGLTSSSSSVPRAMTIALEQDGNNRAELPMFQATLTRRYQQEVCNNDAMNSKKETQDKPSSVFKSLAKLFWSYTEKAGATDTKSYRGLL
jgi:hypothetical protein